MKHISKSKCTKHLSVGPLLEVQMSKNVHAVVARSTFPIQNVQKNSRFGALLEVQMSKKCTLLWREAYFEVKMYKNTTCSDHCWTFRCGFAWLAQGIVHLVKSEQNVKLWQQFQLQPPLHYTPLHYTTTTTTTATTTTTTTTTTLHYIHYTITLH